MTLHSELKMNFENERVHKKELLKEILQQGSVATLALYDEPYPYIVPLNYGFEWEEKLVFYFHMPYQGHRINLLQKNNYVALNVNQFLDRAGYEKYQGWDHDFRSVNCFGKAEIVSADDEEEYVKGLSLLCLNNNRKAIKRAPEQMRQKVCLLKVIADEITGKAQYPLHRIEDVPIPANRG